MKCLGSLPKPLLAIGFLLLTTVVARGAPESAEGYAGREACAVCHEEVVQKLARTVHGAEKEPERIDAAAWGCEGCHGPGQAHVDADGDPDQIRKLAEATAEEASAVCLACHGGAEERINFRRSEHHAAQTSCIDCHDVHGDNLHDRLLRDEPNTLCFSCHGEVRKDFALTYHHKVEEGLVRCIDCHNQHGGFARQQRSHGTEQTCLRCHQDKQGPFTFEHMALRLEGCLTCHIPHGSNNPRLLTRNEQQFLCLECHSQLTSEVFSQPTPTFHNLTQARWQRCTSCHVMIHGSNLNEVFFE